ncbi:transcriptional regulator [Neogemmobacter tilapiae]|uniref:Transcriptional regulator n=1 Tax=Neogemmobacter tilapiae TaxID=875041 RepID=A0A918TLC8_9RHOB|nr:transcriptional regulator [Gemmobacter tilapiae]GHC52058.1 transcriptional regulator [Gemmobacter tilapiae]
MGRQKLVSDAEVFALIRPLLVAGGEKAVSFGTVSRATGLAGATLVQRFGTADGMINALARAEWAALQARLADLPDGAAHQALKALGAFPAWLLVISQREVGLRQTALDFRVAVQAELAGRLGGGAKGHEQAALAFALWQGQALWEALGDKDFRLKDGMKRISG